MLMKRPLHMPSALFAALVGAASFCACTLQSRLDGSSANEAELAPGLIDVELRGVSAEHLTLAKSLGDVLEDDAVEDGPLDAFLPRAMHEEFLELRTSDTAHALSVLRGRSDVLYAEPEVRVHALFVPDDALYPKQWHLKAAGAESAWDAARGANVTVAVLDTGVAQLDDLDPARLLPGFNFITHSGEVGAASDDHFHGTHVAGTIAESTDNGRGGAGMAPLAKILPLKVLSAEGSGTSASIAEAIRYAADHGAQVINLSLGSGARSAAMEFAVAYAQRRGALVVAAAGNTGLRGVAFPAAYPGAFAVSAVGPTGSLAPYSTFGSELALAAPGGDKTLGEEQAVLQQTREDSGQPGYRFLQGTSMATPHVSGAAALVASVGVSSPQAIARLLRDTAGAAPRSTDGGVSGADQYGAGLLDAGAAVRRATTWWGLERFGLGVVGAILALGHARRMHQLRPNQAPSTMFWAALGVASGAIAIAAPLGYARLPGVDLLALAPAAMPMRWLGAPGASLIATLAAYLGWSALGPLLLGAIGRLAATAERAPVTGVGALAGGVAFGQAGLLLQTAAVGAVHLPGLPPIAAAVWLGLNAFVCWLIGRALLARRA
jgi:serine protease